MMCNCAKEIEERVRTETDATFAQMEHFGATWSAIRIIPRRKDGSESKVSRYVTVPWRYCPFCGKSVRV